MKVINANIRTKLDTMVNRKYKRISALTLVSVFVVVIASACGGRSETDSAKNVTKGAPEKRGEEIVGEFLKRDASPFRKIRVRFTIKAEDEPEKVYELDTWRKQTADGTTTLSQIIKPVEDSDLGSLTIEQKGQKTTVVTYAASRGEFRETDTKKMFFGGLTAGELLGEWDKFAFKFLSEKEIGGYKVFEVEGKLKSEAESVVSRMNVLFRVENYLPAEIHLFDTTGREIRTYQFSDYKEVAEHPYAAKTEVENPVYKAKIVIEILGRELPATLDDALFTREKLKQFVRK
ncbi:MAG: outer membrane lipoprotein-sorting protein [Pyrinomonadaceae bacterium]